MIYIMIVDKENNLDLLDESFEKKSEESKKSRNL